MAFLRPGRIASADRAINHVIAFGQSLSSGWEGWPALSVRPRHDSLMLGRSVRPASEDAPDWAPVGEAAFHPLAATVQDHRSGRLLSPLETASLPRDAVALGETVLEAAVAEWRGRTRTFAPPRRILASSAGVGGRTLEALSKGARPELFNRLRACARLARDLAQGDYTIAALLMLQGEHNGRGLEGGTADRADYKALFLRFLADFDADVVQGVAGQALPPAVFTYQIGGVFADDAMGVAHAQLELALEQERVFLAAPVYPVTAKGLHLDANGYRWLGAQFGKVMHKVLTLGEDWRPLHPVSAELAAASVRIAFHVPVPPLAWGRPYVLHEARDWADKGFTVTDQDGVVPVQEAILAERHVMLHLARVPGPGAELRYADHTHHRGHGCLHDSDPTLAQDLYQFDPVSGHWPEANIAELVGKPYPLLNWCTSFRMPITPARPSP
jgi:hypothetical protein